ncbi:hypothetical protein [Armatimonas rosea]|uniref:Uncharacterized protein n=1 Tax=Armatimonas rosea TaxID=685828 RepID=A0A7W9SQC8_ARMRO|nr:hypothetical protein [Armatimonas rosea]MBB6050515.1 hypothetical protein [Armatimonas rosea]
MTLAREQVVKYLYTIYHRESGWVKAQVALVDAGSDIVPFLMEFIEAELQSIVQTEYRPEYEKMDRLMAVLAQYADPRSLPLFVRFMYQTNRHFGEAYWHQIRMALEHRATEEDIAALIALLQRAEPKWVATAYVTELHATEALAIAQSLVRMAEQDPKPELRAVLPMLTFTLARPFEFIGLRRRLKAALANNSLPIPADAKESIQESLPIPVDAEPILES